MSKTNRKAHWINNTAAIIAELPIREALQFRADMAEARRWERDLNGFTKAEQIARLNRTMEGVALDMQDAGDEFEALGTPSRLCVYYVKLARMQALLAQRQDLQA